MDAHH
jgi:hypothetical protein